MVSPEALRLARRASNLTQEQLARAAKMHLSRFRRIERGVQKPTRADLVALVAAMPLLRAGLTRRRATEETEAWWER
jgi:transcriptional regulator with XRE-family HTH domain